MVKGSSRNSSNNCGVNTANLLLDLFVNVTIMTVDNNFSTIFLGSLQLVRVTINGDNVSTKDVVGKLDTEVTKTTGTNN